ncbi:hypothetical protein [Methanococcus maripaludis]|uniref:ATP/ADP translocase n=1 Tax=Methanococcus maripaludis TaxID=39152 RepID=A0A7J9SCL2_METMI|nr:hypothetical protein [Methanococcus maripaludis]MBA2861049.1 ATP/ADP translocase [Methanococcus maripaludis]MBB6497837.1 ATP/ADP translocase [Methanococcus maripaludis]
MIEQIFDNPVSIATFATTTVFYMIYMSEVYDKNKSVKIIILGFAGYFVLLGIVFWINGII